MSPVRIAVALSTLLLANGASHREPNARVVVQADDPEEVRKYTKALYCVIRTWPLALEKYDLPLPTAPVANSSDYKAFRKQLRMALLSWIDKGIFAGANDHKDFEDAWRAALSTEFAPGITISTRANYLHSILMDAKLASRSIDLNANADAILSAPWCGLTPQRPGVEVQDFNKRLKQLMDDTGGGGSSGGGLIKPPKW